MTALDYVLMIGFMGGMVAIGFLYAARLKDLRDMFAAGGRSPWWISGLSCFMTMFTANTFVVWGGIAYKYGLAAISINLCYGLAALLVGRLIAARWQRMQLTSVAQFVEMRFGKATVQLYTWIKGGLTVFLMGAGIYAFSRLLCALLPLQEGHWLADPDTGNLSVDFVSIALSIVIVVYTMTGGLWAVLVTGVLQFVVLMTAVLLVLPLALVRIGSIPAFLQQIPHGFFSPTALEYNWLFLGGWVLIHVFVWGGEWQFAQRYICVPSEKDARKTAYLTGILYLVSPFIWMLPPLLYRGINPSAFHEEAYILMCKEVLPAGMLGLMMAAMLSATSSTVAGVLNVYAGAYTYELYYRYICPTASQRHLVWAGRVITVLLGALLICSCLIIRRADVTKFVIIFSSLLYTPWLLPTIWGLFSRRIGQTDFWLTVGISMTIIAAYLMGFNETFGGILRGVAFLQRFTAYSDSHPKTVSLILGNVPPVVILAALQIKRGKTVNPGWEKVRNHVEACRKESPILAESLLPVRVIAWSLAVLGFVMACVAATADRDRGVLTIFTAILISLSVLLFVLVKRYRQTLYREMHHE